MSLILKISRWTVSGIFVLLFVSAGIGFVYQALAEASDLDRVPPPGRLIDVDGNLMHIYCQGEGSPTAIIEQGTGGYYDTWSAVNQQMSSITRVCAYDRAGAGYSDPLGRSPGSAEIADRLQKLLVEAQIDDELILVGWSAGGIYVREFYRKYPEKVRGMILVDSSHEQQRSRLIDPTPPRSGLDFERLASYLGPFGIIRLSGEVERSVDRGPGTEEQKARLKVVQNQSHWVKSYYDEIEKFEEELALDRTPPQLGDLPLIVLTRGREVVQGGMPSYYTLETLQRNEVAWQEMQEELTDLSSEGRQVIASHSGHDIHRSEPELIVGALRELVALAEIR